MATHSINELRSHSAILDVHCNPDQSASECRPPGAMTGLYTNVLVRHLTQDDAIQSRRATQIIEHQFTSERPGFISVESVWVLARVYSLYNFEIAALVKHLLQADTFVVQNEPEAFIALIALRSGAGSFSDALIRAWATGPDAPSP